MTHLRKEIKALKDETMSELRVLKGYVDGDFQNSMIWSAERLSKNIANLSKMLKEEGKEENQR